MNYIHEAIKKFMQDNGIKLNERFYFACEQPFTSGNGYFTSNQEAKYEFHTCFIGEKNKETESNILINILNGSLKIEPLHSYMPENGDTYYYFCHASQINLERLTVRSAKWSTSLEDLARYDTGNCFRSEAEANRESEEFYFFKVEEYQKELKHTHDNMFFKKEEK